MTGTTRNTPDHNNLQHIGTSGTAEVTAIAIGRNEGERLMRCLRSLLPQVRRVIYVDSGSTDGSAEAAERLGAKVVSLDMSIPFTAARARNAGMAEAEEATFVQFVDGDCEVEPGWITTALQALQSDSALGIVAGRRRELHPEASIYNLICDAEWNTPVGPARAVGGDMLARRMALEAVSGFDPSLIAGEEPEMCLRVARAGWGIARLDAPMTIHDAAMTRFSQWWRRSRRAGHAFAEVSWRHRRGAEQFWKAETRRSIFWSGLLLAILLAGLIVSPLCLAALAIFPLQIARIALRDPEPQHRWTRAAFTLLGKLPEAVGVLEFHLRRISGKRAGLIEYK